MKKLILFLTLCLALNTFGMVVCADEATDSYLPGLNIVIDGVAIDTDQASFIEDGRTLVPAKSFAIAIGATITETAKTVVLETENLSCTLTTDSNLVTDSLGAQHYLDAYARQKNGSHFIPIRFIAERFGYTVDFKQVMAEDGSVYASVVLADKAAQVVIPDEEKETLSVICPNKETLTDLLQIAADITQKDVKLYLQEDTLYQEYVTVFWAAGENVIVYDDGSSDVLKKMVSTDKTVKDLRPYLETQMPKTLALIDSDETVKAAVTRDDGTIIAIPVQNGNSLERFYLPGAIDTESAVAYIHAYNEFLQAISK